MTQAGNPGIAINGSVVSAELFDSPAARWSPTTVWCTWRRFASIAARGPADAPVALSFEWDPSKAEASERKHGLSFDEAVSAFRDPGSLTIPDADHSEREEHFALLGMSASGRLLVVIHAERRDRLRIISARQATRQEWRAYADRR